ncbi:YbaK/EbsC family protein [Acetonema longum]|uniref:Putative DNA-binding protein n=1 Tax=Acetonema longum DSM 6540 TaxID=1009370 RepID=F7NN92_9FIRM|nr:YbaK/EbsC family protein [Acetonema longum]EGO62477.1 putative DNA-binding protein [Acetonema longum DSM 6540]
MLEKKGTYALLDKYNFIYEVYDHPAVNSIEELDTLNIPYKKQIAKNLFLSDDRKNDYFLVTVPGHKTVNLKILRAKINSRRLCLASEQELWKMLLLKRGCVTPVGILNNTRKNGRGRI